MIGGVTTVAENAFHAALLLVERKDLHDRMALGCGSIVSRSRILTAAHVVRGATSVQAMYYQRRFTPEQARHVQSIYVQPFQRFVFQTLENDLAVVVFAPYTFPSANVIPIAADYPTGGAAFVAGYGFQTSSSTAPSMVPLLGPLTVRTVCSNAVNSTESHFCAVANHPAVLCPGDNGAGLYTGTGNNLILVNGMSIY